MQTLSCTIGNWHAEAQLQEVGTGKLMAIISLTDETGNTMNDSKHTIVFEHQQGQDRQTEMETLVRRLLHERYKI